MLDMRMVEVGSIGQRFVLLMRAIEKYTLGKHKVFIILELFSSTHAPVQNRRECPNEHYLYLKAEYLSSQQKI
jgi:hypothetical protein